MNLCLVQELADNFKVDLYNLQYLMILFYILKKQARQIEQKSGTILKKENTNTDRYTDTHTKEFRPRLKNGIAVQPLFLACIL